MEAEEDMKKSRLMKKGRLMRTWKKQVVEECEAEENMKKAG